MSSSFARVIISLLCAGIASHDSVAEPIGKLTGMFFCSRFTIQTYRDDESGLGSFEILRETRRVYEKSGYCFTVGRAYCASESAPRLIGQDLTASGHPHVVVYEWTGGAHCCEVARVFRLDDDCHLLAEIDGRDGEVTFHETAPGKPWEVRLRDWVFAYWPQGFAASPAPDVILRWSNGRFVVAHERMQKPAPLRKDLEALAAKIREDKSWQTSPPTIPPELYFTALDLMYTGHEEAGWEFIRLAWNPENATQSEFVSGLRHRLAKSRYWQALKQR